ncbi:hypothetical protein ACVWYO_002053 [Sphingomonas sp. UYP23]
MRLSRRPLRSDSLGIYASQAFRDSASHAARPSVRPSVRQRESPAPAASSRCSSRIRAFSSSTTDASVSAGEPRWKPPFRPSIVTGAASYHRSYVHRTAQSLRTAAIATDPLDLGAIGSATIAMADAPPRGVCPFADCSLRIRFHRPQRGRRPRIRPKADPFGPYVTPTSKRPDVLHLHVPIHSETIHNVYKQSVTVIVQIAELS